MLIVKNIACLQDYYSEKYAVMYYKNGNNIGIREKFGKKTQAFSFGGKKCGLAEEALRSFADDCLKKLDAGQSVDDVYAWVVEVVGAPDLD